jgi:hypothetical protein
MRKDEGLLDGASGTGREIDRRTIAKGVAWTVPVVIVATAAPAAAASGGVTLAGSRSSGTFTFTVTNDGSKPVKVVITNVSPGANWEVPTSQQNIPKGQSRSFSLADQSGGASVVTVSYTVDGAGFSSAVPVA